MLNIITNNKNNRNFFSSIFTDLIPDNILINNDKKLRLNIKETSFHYEFEIELPGVKKDDINVSIADDVLTVSVNINEEVNTETTKYIRKERKYGTYSRSFSIPNINADGINASLDNGILTLILPKAEDREIEKKVINIE